jgi:exosortase A
MTLGARISAFRRDAENDQWLRDAGLLLVCVAVLAGIFWREAAGAVRVWIDSPTFNHGFLIIPISLFMMWERRSAASQTPHRPMPLAAPLLLPLSFAWLLASFMAILELQQFIVLTMLQVTLLSAFGWPAYRRYMAPFLYLYFLVPSGAEFVPELQQVTAKLAVFGLHLIGIPVFSDGAIIEIPAGSFAVAEACAGLRFLVAAVAFGVFYATQIYRSIWRRLVFIALSIAIPILANGLRVFGLISAAQWLGSPTAALADHLLYGWIFFSVVLIALIFVGRAFSDMDSLDDPQPENADAPAPDTRRLVGALALCCGLAALFPVAALFLNGWTNIPLPSIAPAVSSSWRQVFVENNWHPIVVDPSKTFADSFTSGDDTVYRFVALYEGANANNLLRSENRVADEHDWKFDSNRLEHVRIGGRDVPVSVTKIGDGISNLTVWSFYDIGGEEKTSTLSIKLGQLRERLFGGHCLPAFVALATPNDNPAGLQRFFSQSQSLPAYLCGGAKAR